MGPGSVTSLAFRISERSVPGTSATARPLSAGGKQRQHGKIRSDPANTLPAVMPRMEQKGET